MNTEADTCRKFVVPKLQAAGWNKKPHSIAEQRTITDGRVVPVGKVRKVFLYYPLKRVGLDVDQNSRVPQDQQIVRLEPLTADSGAYTNGEMGAANARA